jgi:hypothetical protein
MEPRHCSLEHAAGRNKLCPGDTCPFWTDGHCAVAPYWADFGNDPHLVELLLGLRDDLARQEPRRVLRAIHPPGLA